LNVLRSALKASSAGGLALRVNLLLFGWSSSGSAGSSPNNAVRNSALASLDRAAAAAAAATAAAAAGGEKVMFRSKEDLAVDTIFLDVADVARLTDDDDAENYYHEEVNAVPTTANKKNAKAKDLPSKEKLGAIAPVAVALALEKEKKPRGRRAISTQEAAMLSGRELIADKERRMRNSNLAEGNGYITDSAASSATGAQPKQLSFASPLKLSEEILIILDVETTGLNPATSRIIQLAAKVLGSSNPSDCFSAYILPTNERVSQQIEQLTGISDRFLRNGGLDKSTGTFHEKAEEFPAVYNDFVKWCNGLLSRSAAAASATSRSNGGEEKKKLGICIVAHNAGYDLRMLNAELRRLPSRLLHRDTGISSSLDTLKLLKSKELWATGSGSSGSSSSFGGARELLPRPNSFRQVDIHAHLLNEPMNAAHNAMGDVLGLEAILECSYVRERWEALATKMTKPILGSVIDGGGELKQMKSTSAADKFKRL
jgi:DNA polymerase III epsilon subunit-like protein